MAMQETEWNFSELLPGKLCFTFAKYLILIRVLFLWHKIMSHKCSTKMLSLIGSTQTCSECTHNYRIAWSCTEPQDRFMH